jgi:cytochrome c-type biogenesis protein CcmH
MPNRHLPSPQLLQSKLVWWGTLLLTLTLSTFFTCAAAAKCPQTSLAQIEKEVMCPVCGTPLALAEAPQAKRERKLIADLIAQCQSKTAIKERLVKEFGEAVLATPNNSGFGRAAYLVPTGIGTIVLLAIGYLVIVRRRPTAVKEFPTAHTSSTLRDSDLDADMARYDL